MAKGLKMSTRSSRRIVKEGLGLKAYKFQRGHLISAASNKKKRLDRGKRMLAKIERAGRKSIIWADEKLFTVQAVSNVQNDRVYAGSQSDPPERSRVQFRRQKPAGVMVWAALGSDGSMSPMLFVEDGVKVDCEKYTKMPAENVLPWVTETYGTHYIFTQDKAPAPTAKRPRNGARTIFCGFWDKEL